MTNNSTFTIDRTAGGEVDIHGGSIQHSNRQTVEHQTPTSSTADSKSGRLVNVISREKGRAVPASEARDHDLVEFGGGKYAVRTLLARGDLIRDQDGALRFAGEAEKAGRQAERVAAEKASQQPAAAPEAVSGDVEQVITEVATTANPSDVMSVISAVSKGEEPSENALGLIASRMGVEPEQVSEKMATIRAAFEQQALKSVSSFGMEQDIMAWGYANAPELMQRAIRQHATQRTTAGYQAVAKQFVENLDRIDPEAVLQAELPQGWTAKQTKGGRVVLVSPQGREHSWQALAKSGRLTVSRRK